MENNTVAQNAVNRELLESIRELLDNEKKNLMINRIRLVLVSACLAVCIMVAAITLGKFSALMQKADTAADVLTEAGNNINTLANDLEKVDFEKLGKSLNSIVDISGETIGEIHQAAGGLDQLVKDADEAMQHINSINFEDLNNGIQRLNDVLEPVANFFKIFK